MLKCNEVSRLAATEEIAQAGFLKRIEFRLHLMMCHHCRNYVRQIRQIGTAARRVLGTTSEDDAIVARLEEDVLRTVCGDSAGESAGGTSASPRGRRTGGGDTPGR